MADFYGHSHDPSEGEVTEAAPPEVDDHAASNLGKRKRKTALEALESKLEELQTKKEKKAAQIAKFLDGRPQLTLKKEQDQLEKWQGELSNIDADIITITEKLGSKKAAKAAEDAHKQMKVARAAADAEAREHMSDAGAQVLVELKLRYDDKFNNTTDKVEAVWEQHASGVAALW
ncbi:hypothetical protein AB1Y20_022505 [Prymnesium parvum]|uniref:Uncharacterized protein n=1 Tax=Prymnesium parvum TaxID=97485 RepID=A0AB34JHS2_PRYPA